jgi:RIO kinase 1
LSSRRRVEKEAEDIERRYEEESLMLEKDSEALQTMEEVFDRLTLQAIHKLFNRGIIKEIEGVVNAGKEARIYWGLDPEGRELAIKIYYTKTADFRRGMLKYMVGDPRFKKIRRNPRSIVYTWAQKEFKNLQLVTRAGVNSPEPIDIYRNVLVMTFIGEDGIPAPLLKEVELQDPLEFYKTLLDETRIMYLDAGLVHGDLSEYNIMVWKNKPVIFDISQAMLTVHPLSEELIERDIRNINSYFARLGIDVFEEEKIEEWMKGGTEDLY